MDFKVYSFNEWKESDEYYLQKWFINKKLSVTKWFEGAELADLEFDYFEFDTTHTYGVASAILYFHEEGVQWKLFMKIDTEASAGGNIDMVTLSLLGYDKSNDGLLGNIDNEVNDADITPDLLIEMINQFKIEFMPEEEEGDVQKIEL